MPIPQKDLDDALAAEKEGKEAAVRAAAARIDTIKKENAALDAEIKMIKASIDALQKAGASTARWEADLKTASRTIRENNQEISEAIKLLKTHHDLSEKDIHQLEARIALYEVLAHKLIKYASSLDETAIAYSLLSLRVDQAVQAISGFSASTRFTIEDVKKLRDNLRLTREETIDFLAAWTKSRDLGVTTASIDRMGQALIRLRGHAQGIARLKELLQLNISATDLEALSGGQPRSD